jgi:hypothetical protein
MQRVRLHQQPLEIHAIQQLAQRRDLTAGIGGVGALGDGHTQAVGVEAHLGNETRCARSGFIDRAPQRLAVTDQGVDGFGLADLGAHPVLEQALKAFHIKLSQQQPEGGIRRRLGDMGAQQLVERLAVTLGETLHAQQRALAAQDREDRHQQHPPLGKTDPTTHAAIGQRLEKADQIACSSRGFGRGAKGEERFPRTTALIPGPVQGYWDRLLMDPTLYNYDLGHRRNG